MERTNHLPAPRRRKRARGASISSANFKFLIMCVIVITGMIVGAAVIQRGYALYYTKGLFESFISLRQSQGFFSVFFSSLGSVLILLIIVFISGLSAAGIPISFAVLIYKGLGIGLTCGYLYSSYGLNGLLFSTAIIVPHAFISSVALILACRESCRMSMFIFSQLLPESKYYKLWNDFKLFCRRYLVILVISIISCFIDAMLSKLFIGLISL